MSARGGLYWRLKDTGLSWTDRLKLVRYAWKTAQVCIPNKEQVLIDWLGLALAGKQRVPAEHSSEVWRCLADVLNTQHAHERSSQGHHLVLKPALFQVVLEELEKAFKEHHKPHHDVIISCAHSLLVSRNPHFNYTLISNFENIVRILSCSLQLCATEVLCGRPVPKKFVLLLEASLQKCVPRGNTQHVIQQCSTHLLPSAMMFIHAVSQETATCSLAIHVEQLVNLLNKLLFSMELHQYYELYLRVKVDSEKPKVKEKVVEKKKKGTEQVPKFISNVFSSIFQQDFQQTVAYLPHFYHGFILAYRSEEKTAAFKMLVHLVDSLDLGIKGQGQFKPEEQLKALSACLKEAVKLEVYDPTSDLSSGGHQLKWFQELTGRLLHMSQRSCDWFMCLQFLLAMSHSILEPQLSAILTQAWLNTDSLSDDAKDAQGNFLSNLATTYARLRQLSRLVKYMLESFKSNDDMESLRWPIQLRESLSSSFAALPATVCLEVWDILQTELVQHYVPSLTDNNGNVSDLEAVCDLAALFLSHIKVVDYSVTLAIKTSVHKKLQEMATEILAPAMRHFLKHAGAAAGPMLHLAWSWGELYMLLAHYASDLGDIGAALKQQALKASFVDDLSVLHGYLSGEEWVKIHKSLKKMDSPGVSYLWNLCLAQKLQACLLFGGGEVKVIAMKEITRALQVMTSDLDLESTEVWDGRYQSLSHDAQIVAHWWLLSRYLNAALPFCERSQVADLARLVVQSLVAEKQLCQRGEWTLRDISREVVGRTSFHESPEMQTMIVTELCHQMSAQLKTVPKKSPKKQKTSDTVAIGTVLNHLGDSEINWTGEDESLVLKLQILKPSFKSMIKSDVQPFKLSNETLQSFVTYLKILDLLPLEYFTSVNRLRGIFTLISVLAANTDSGSLEMRQTFYKLGLQALECLLVATSGTTLFSVVDAGDICGWLIKLGSQLRGFQMPKLCDLHSRTLSSLVRLSTRSLESLKQLESFTEMLCEDIKTHAKPGKHTEITWSVFQAAVISAQVLTKMLTKQSLKDDIRDACQIQLKNLQMSLLKLHKQFLSAPPEESLEVMALSLEGVSGMIDTAAKEEEDFSTAKIGKMLMPTCEMCLRLCSQHQNFHKYHKGPLSFIQSLSRHHAKVKDLCPTNFMQETWKLLLNYLQWKHENTLSLKQKYNRNKNRNKGRHSNIIQEVLGLAESTEQMDVDETTVQISEDKSAEDTDVQQEVLDTVARVISTFSAGEFQAALVALVETVDLTQSTMSTILVAVQVWSRLLEAQLPEERVKVLLLTSQSILLRFLPLTSQLQHSPSSESVTRLQVEVYQCQTKMLAFGGTFLSPQCVSLCIHSCQYASLENSSMTEFVSTVYAVYNVLNEALMQHSATIFKSIPPFIAAAKRLMLAVIQRSDQNRNPLAEDDLIGCAHLIDRLFSLIVTHKVEFARVAPYIIADYVNEVQKVTLLPKVKRSLVPAMYRLFELCDHHSIALLQTNLAPGVKEVFKTLHEEYNKYYKYTGKI